MVTAEHSPHICPECDDTVPAHSLSSPPEHTGFVFKWDLGSSEEATAICPTCGAKLVGSWVPRHLEA